jgi:hypothetical protein
MGNELNVAHVERQIPTRRHRQLEIRSAEYPQDAARRNVRRKRQSFSSTCSSRTEMMNGVGTTISCIARRFGYDIMISAEESASESRRQINGACGSFPSTTTARGTLSVDSPCFHLRRLSIAPAMSGAKCMSKISVSSFDKEIEPSCWATMRRGKRVFDGAVSMTASGSSVLRTSVLIQGTKK